MGTLIPWAVGFVPGSRCVAAAGLGSAGFLRSGFASGEVAGRLAGADGVETLLAGLEAMGSEDEALARS